MATGLLNYYRTSTGKKMVMAVTGAIIFGFVVIHMLGNLQVFRGPEVLNHYAAFLQGLGGVLWVMRGIMLIAVVLHIVSATQVTLQSWAARPEGYAVQRYRETTYAARTMRWGGPIILLFIIYHLLHFTFGTVHPTAGHFDKANVYQNVVMGFQVPWVAGFYILASMAVGLHLYHGAWSMLQTMGISHPGWNRWRKAFAVVFALAVTIGNISMPIAVLTGIVTLD